MLTPEAAREMLKQHKSESVLQERIARLGDFPETIRDHARSLFHFEDASPGNLSYWQRRNEITARVDAAWKALGKGEIDALITALLPGIAPYALRALQDVTRFPYPVGHARKPFRAPTNNRLMDGKCREFIESLFSNLGDYPADIEWIAAWAPHAWNYGGEFVSQLLAAAIDTHDEKGQKVFDILLASANGEHEIGQMGRHIIGAFTKCARTDAWDYIEKLLLAAQREEGLRQSILEAVDEGHPDIFPRFLRLVLEHNLERFSAVVRAVDVWFGFLWEAMSARKARDIIEHALKFLDSPDAARDAIAAAKALPAPVAVKTKGKKLADPADEVEPAFIALWTLAFRDVTPAASHAIDLLDAPHPDVRFIAVHFLALLSLTGAVAQGLMKALDDPDERVAARALRHFQPANLYNTLRPRPDIPNLFEKLEALLARAPESPLQLAPIVWPWMSFTWSKATVANALVGILTDRPPTRLVPHLPHFDSSARHAAARHLGKSTEWDDATRETLFFLVGDAASSVREEALKHLKKCTLAPADALGLEALLTRKSADLRRGILTLLLSQPDDAALASADRLLAAKDLLQRLAGLELLRLLTDAARAPDACRNRAAAYQESHPRLAADERTHLDTLLKPPAETLSAENCFGLINPADRTPPAKPQPRSIQYVTPAAIALVKELDALIHTHREHPITLKNRSSESLEEQLLGNVKWNFPTVDRNKPNPDELPLREIWTASFDQRPAALRDADALELLRAEWLVDRSIERYGSRNTQHSTLHALMVGPSQALKYPILLDHIIDWLLALNPPPTAPAIDFYLDGLDNTLAALPPAGFTQDAKMPWRDYTSPIIAWAYRTAVAARRGSYDQVARAFRLARYIDEPAAGMSRHRSDLLHPWSLGAASDADVYDFFLGPRDNSSYGRNSDLGRQCRLKPTEEVQSFPQLLPILHACRARVLQIELTRGETPTPVSDIANSLGHSGGLDVLLPFLTVAERDTFSRGHNWGSTSKPVVFSHIIRTTFPADTDTPAAFAAKTRAAAIPDSRLIELAVYAPQWADHVAEALGWPALPDAVWWIHAHTRDRGWSVEADIRACWKAQLAQRTALDADDLLDGAVDVAWFNRIHKDLGKKRWDALYAAAKFAASGGGHIRAQLFADAMLGKVKSKDLTARITTKRQQDPVRALGLLPLPADPEKARTEILKRYKTLQEFIRGCKQFGSQRQASEKRAAAIGMENLARTAGYADPVRLQWAMEAHATADLAAGPVAVSIDDVTVSLAIDPEGDPEIAIARKGKSLASVPAALKKNPRIEALFARKTDLKRSSSRMRSSLEQAMVRGDAFSPRQLAELLANPLLAPHLARLVFVGDAIAGYPADAGKVLIDYAGHAHALKSTDTLRLAHPRDLFDARHWSDWQHDCFARERVQPFKQIFRELYLPTSTERQARDISRRYAGHQVQPRQALALLTARGWVHSPDTGVFKVFHDARLAVWLTFQEAFFTPAEIEGLTLEGVRFTTRDRQGEPMPIDAVPPRLFSEIMRDLDLVVSVAHRGGVDPEASASTVEMRTNLLHETLALLNLDNVRIQDSHALIKGRLANYTLHLGSAVTHRQPGGALYIVAVHSQHRGRLFLPFADDDPKTAEVLSKVLLLARDHEVKDPYLLAQLRADSRAPRKAAPHSRIIADAVAAPPPNSPHLLIAHLPPNLLP